MVFVTVKFPHEHTSETIVNDILSLIFVRHFVVIGDPDSALLVVQPWDLGIIVPMSLEPVFVDVVLFEIGELEEPWLPGTIRSSSVVAERWSVDTSPSSTIAANSDHDLFFGDTKVDE